MNLITDLLEVVLQGGLLVLAVVAIGSALYIMGQLAATISAWLIERRKLIRGGLIAIDKRLAPYGNTPIFQFAYAQLGELKKHTDDPNDPLVRKLTETVNDALRFELLKAAKVSELLTGGLETLRGLFDGIPSEEETSAG